MKLIPYNNIVVAKLLEEKKEVNGLVLPDKERGRFVKLEVIAIGGGVDFTPKLETKDIIYANDRFEILDLKEKLGFINSIDILAKEI